jgi:hypothetical protein
MEFKPFIYIKMLEKCKLLKLWHVIEVARKNFPQKKHILHFSGYVFYLENQNIIFCSKLLLQYK